MRSVLAKLLETSTFITVHPHLKKLNGKNSNQRLSRIGNFYSEHSFIGVQPHEICLLNDAVGTELHAYLLEFDTVHGRWPAQISFDSESIIVDKQQFPMLAVERIEQLPLKDTGIDL